MGDHSKYIAKHVDADLRFWRRPDIDNCVQVGFPNDKTEGENKNMHASHEKHRVQIQDIRGKESSYTLDKNGFVYLSHEMPELDKASNETHIKDTIIPKTEELVRKLTGATKTVTFVHRVRCLAADTSRLANNRAPAHDVHSDFTPTGALHYLKTLVPDEQERTHLLAGRVLIINVWRPLKTIQRDPLAVCDWSSVSIQDEGVPTRLTLPSGWNELGRYAFSPNQRWCYLSGQHPNEPLVFMQFDSSKVDEGGFTVPHTAFVDPEYSDSAARESLEIKIGITDAAPRRSTRSITVLAQHPTLPVAITSIRTPQNSFCNLVSADNSPEACISRGSPAITLAPSWHYGNTAWQTLERPLRLESGGMEEAQCRLFGGEPGDDVSLCYRMLEYFGGLDYIDSTSGHALGD